MKNKICLFACFIPLLVHAQLLEVEPNGYFLGSTSTGVQEVILGLECQGYLPCACPLDNPDCCDPIDFDYWDLPNNIEGSHTLSFNGDILKIYSYPNSTSASGTLLYSISDIDTITIDFDINLKYRILSEKFPTGHSYNFTLNVLPPAPHISSNSPMYIGSSNIAPDSSAILQLESTSKGFLPPRLSKEEILLIENPVDGLMVYSITDNMPLYFNNVWKDFSGNPRIPSIGDHAYGGIIIYVSHLGEIAVVDTSYLNTPDTVIWGCEGLDIPAIEQIVVPFSVGSSFTHIIFDSCSTSAVAADIALSHIIHSNGVSYDDWHLPTNSSYLYQLKNTLNNQAFQHVEFWVAQQVDENNALYSGEYDLLPSLKSSLRRLIQ